MATYTQLVDMVSDWSNRDTAVLSYATIKTMINFAADNAYRTLRVPALEGLKQYDAITIDSSITNNKLAIPNDAIEFIQLRKKSSDHVYSDYDIYASKLDVKSFYQDWMDTDQRYFYTREQNNLVVFPDQKAGELYELYYYKRLPESNARYSVVSGNGHSTSNFADHKSDNTFQMNSYLWKGSTKTNLMNGIKVATNDASYPAEGPNVFTRDPDLEDQIFEVTSSNSTTALPTGFYLGKLATNWLRDDNEKILLYGALNEAFTYLNEPAQAQLYAAKFDTEIKLLNDEDKTRGLKGGTVTAHYDSHLI